MIGLLLIVAAAVLLPVTPGTSAVATASGAPSLGAFGLAMVFVLLTYGGWNEAAYISAEIRDGRRNMVLALAVSILIITALYLIVTWAYWKGLGMAGMAKSEVLAADLMRVVFGTTGEKIMALLVAVAAITSINATMIVGARTSYAMGCDWLLLRRLAQWDGARGTPEAAIRIQCLAALLLVLIGAATGIGFKSMVEFTAPVFWLFFLLSGISLFALRRREPLSPRPFKVPLYPLLPLLFCASCACMLWASVPYVYNQSLGGLNAAWIDIAVLAFGMLLLLVMHRFCTRFDQPAVSSK